MRCERQQVITRLRCAAGHLQAVVKMVEMDKPSDDILHQLEAVQAALRATRRLLIEGQQQTHIEVIQTSFNVEERDQALESLLRSYKKLIR